MRRLPASLLAALVLGAGSAAQGLSISVTPRVVGLGDSGVVTVAGVPGHLAFLLTSRSPGPIQLPLVGRMEVGEDGLDYVVLGTLPASGTARFSCTLPCSVTTPVYMQAVTIAGTPLALTGKSPQLVLAVEPALIDDCDQNGVDDDCDLQAGLVEDCNGNGLPDSCDVASGASPDVDLDGLPDECCDPLCAVTARYTIEGPLMAFPWLLTVRVVAPGTAGTAQNEIQVSVPSASSLPTTLASPNALLQASDFAHTAGGGLSFLVTYAPGTASAFGTHVLLAGEVEGHCEKRTIGSGLLSRCDLRVGASHPSTNDPGLFEIESVLDACP